MKNDNNNVKKMSLQDSQSIHEQYVKKMENYISRLKLRLIEEKDELRFIEIEEEIKSKENFLKQFKARKAKKEDCKS